MLLKLVVVFLWTQIACASKEHQDWEVAVVINGQIELLQSNGTPVGTTTGAGQFTKLKALTFDTIRHHFIVSDVVKQNDTIFSVELTKETEITPIISDLPDDVQGLAIDPIEDVLYWTDAFNKTINYIYLNDTMAESQLLFQFTEEIPQDIAVDVCRRYIYWTNSDVNRPTIERAFLNGSQKEIIIDSDLKTPLGIAIDYKKQRIYWADKLEGIYYRIDSANLNGDEREIVYEGAHTRPFGIAVDETSVYWTDVNNNALWRFFKTEKGSVPEKIREFHEKPMGIVTKNLQIRSYPDCKEFEIAFEKFGKEIEEVFESFPSEESTEIHHCLNGGELVGGQCRCKTGFTGPYCENENCRNFCIHGICRLSSQGYPKCYCSKGFGGTRCELDMCNSYCLNGGECSYIRGNILPSCVCQKPFTGSRCENSMDFKNLCLMYCKENTSKNDFFISKHRDLICRCQNTGFVISKNNLTSSSLNLRSKSSDDSTLFNSLVSSTDFGIIAGVLGVSIFINIALAMRILLKKRKRDPVQRRFIVKQNVTPLTYRPQPPGDHCEITIENCCNMNVCETPCFEPPILRGKDMEDKKTLLSDMDNGEEAY